MKRLPRWKSCLAGPESGQGTVEYILVLIIVIIIALTLLYRFNGAFKKYTEAFFDGYIACLLETGELPGTGSTCQAEFAAFDGKNGKNLLKDNLPTNKGNWGKGGAGGKGGPKTSGGSGKNGAAGREVVSGGPDRSVGSLRGRSATVPLKTSSGGDGGGGGEGKESGGLLGGIPVARMQNSQRPRSVQMGFSTEGSLVEPTNPEKSSKKSTGKTVEGGSELRPVKAAENMEARRTQASIDDGKDFSVGGLIRLVIIILIIVAMAIFFGGQVLQFMKSRDKGGGGD